ncbi:hypothetical protein [Gemmatimonas sp.]|uniref:hypothetical protein n=1 Tax=Gemmatimonas sp. TaxID=1962908 RepID=UPI00333E4FB2
MKELEAEDTGKLSREATALVESGEWLAKMVAGTAGAIVGVAFRRARQEPPVYLERGIFFNCKPMNRQARTVTTVLGLMILSACASERALAPAAALEETPQMDVPRVKSDAELLVLLDDAGAVRRVMVIGDKQDGRRRMVLSLGFRSLTLTNVANGAVNEEMTSLFSASQEKGLAVTYLRLAGKWSTSLEETLAMELATESDSRAFTRLSAESHQSIVERKAEINAALRKAEENMNVAISVARAGGPAKRAALGGLSVPEAELEGEDCTKKAQKAMNESADFILAAGALIAALDACGASMGLTCFSFRLRTLSICGRDSRWRRPRGSS